VITKLIEQQLSYPAARTYREHKSLFIIIFSCVVFFIAELILGGGALSAKMGLIPAEFIMAGKNLLAQDPGLQNISELFTLIGTIFMHGNLQHILYNMAFLWMFGYLVIEICGQKSFLFVFLLTGMMGAMAHCALNQDSIVPLIGASGSIAGLQGAYFLMALKWHLPQADVWPISRPVSPDNLLIFSAIGLGFDFYSLMNHAATNVAYAAHIGGFISGALLGLFVLRRY